MITVSSSSKFSSDCCCIAFLTGMFGKSEGVPMDLNEIIMYCTRKMYADFPEIRNKVVCVLSHGEGEVCHMCNK